MAEVVIDNVRKSYGKTEILKGIDLTIADGELMVILGPSGCGKSTLLRMVAGLEQITSGEIRIGERRVNELEPKDRDIAMVFQNYALYPHMSVYDNMAYGLKNQGRPRPEIEQRVQEAAAILGLDELLQRKPRQLSGGQRQRVAMGRAIVRHPQVFLFDEPLSNLDAKLRTQMRGEIKRLQQRLATTLLYVTHDQVEAMTLADRLIVMNAGQAEQIGQPLELYQKPQTAFVAAFIGSPAMNLLTGTVGADGCSIELLHGVRLPLPAGKLPIQPGQPLTLGIRPESLRLGADGHTIGTLRLDLIEQLGADTLAHGQLGDDQTTLTVRFSSQQPVRLNEQLPLTVESEQLHLFDAVSGQRLN